MHVRDIVFSYPGQGEALTGLSADIHSGVTLLVGPNAGGKTTLLRLLAGLLSPFSGKVVHAPDETELTPARLRQMSRMVMQDADPQILGADVAEDVMLGKAASNLGDRFDAEARRLLADFGLDGLWHAPVASLSYGQKRKLCLVHALLAGPRMLLLDEPFAGLDYPSAKELRLFIRESRRNGLAQVITSHELEPVYDLADRVVVVDNGRVAVEGEPADLLPDLGQWSVRAPGKGWE